MALLNKASLLTQLDSAAGVATDPATFSALIAALEKLTEDRIVSIATVDDLPDLYTDPLPSGSVFFVDSINVLAMAVGLKWEGIDGRLLRDDEKIDALGWGGGSYGRLGDGTIVDKSSPVTVVGGITNWSQVSAGNFHNLGLTDTGIAYAWGFNGSGRFGDGTTVNRSSPVTVVGGITNWSQVSAGGGQSLGVTATGIAYAWGSGSYGRLGDGTIVDKSSPVTVVGGITNWSQLSAGNQHSLGVTATGIAYAWGANSQGGYYGSYADGRLGDGTSVDRSSPVTVVGGITNWSQVSASPPGGFYLGGGRHSLGLTDTGIAYAWGFGSYGRLGDGTIVHRSSPVTVVGGITNWSQVSAGGNHSLGLTTTGIAYAWGRASNGQVGEGTTVNRSSPVTVVGGITNWSQLSAGGAHSLGLTDTGIAYAWGFNGSSQYGAGGELGDGTITFRSSPVTVVGGITSWSLVEGGYYHSLGIKTRV